MLSVDDASPRRLELMRTKSYDDKKEGKASQAVCETHGCRLSNVLGESGRQFVARGLMDDGLAGSLALALDNWRDVACSTARGRSCVDVT